MTIAFRIQDPRQVVDAMAHALRVAGEMGRNHDFTVGPMDDKELRETLVVFVDGADEVEASEVLGQRYIQEGVAFDAVP